MQIVFSDAQLAHAPQRFLVRGEWKPCPEKPERAALLLDGLRSLDHAVVAPDWLGDAAVMDAVGAVHDPRYLRFLKTAHERWQQLPGAADLVTPNMHPRSRADAYPASIVGQAGYHMADTACPIGGDTWGAVWASAATAVHAARLLLDGGDAVYALCRPPGHHAYADMAGGFCYLNNSAIAAQYLRQRADRVAILDIDVHHGNGTQEIFYRRADVFTASIHADPTNYYPFFWGYADETGQGDGQGFNRNIPLALGSNDASYLRALATVMEAAHRKQAEAVVVALGLDAFEGDPLAGLKVTTSGFREAGRLLGAMKLPTVLVQEGGYPAPELGANLHAVLSGFAAGRKES
ncbi:MAG TPA: histone deacetylase family protein [Terriglobia bacterium]|nr:histone deacetylase family protein [Terriglobia bacterium]